MASKVLVLCQHRELLKYNEWVIITYYFDQVALLYDANDQCLTYCDMYLTGETTETRLYKIYID